MLTQIAQVPVDMLPRVSGVSIDLGLLLARLLAAVAILVVGLIAAKYVRRWVAAAAGRWGDGYAGPVSQGCYWFLVLVVVLAALRQLWVDLALLESVILLAAAGVALAFGLAVGLGGREVVGEILAGYYVRRRFQSGDNVAVLKYQGTVREVGAVATVVETEEEGLPHRHNVPNSVMLKEAVR